MTGDDRQTARAFAASWNTVGRESVYSREQFLDWFAPATPADLEGRSVLELGFGNGSMLYHVASARPARLAGVELGDTLEQTRRNLADVPELELHQGDLTTADLGPFDFVYCIGVLHHLQDPAAGFRAVLRHVRPGGRFHCWVYAHEGNALVRTVVEPVRRIASRLPWWVTKYLIALPLVAPFYGYAKLLCALDRSDAEAAPAPSATLAGRARRAAAALARLLPLHRYSLWIGPRPFWFFHHVAFDQLVTPRTVYLRRRQVEDWLSHPDVAPGSTYVIFRNGNSWKFGGRTRAR